MILIVAVTLALLICCGSCHPHGIVITKLSMLCRIDQLARKYIVTFHEIMLYTEQLTAYECLDPYRQK